MFGMKFKPRNEAERLELAGNPGTQKMRQAVLLHALTVLFPIVLVLK
jgi:hypothetical protein